MKNRIVVALIALIYSSASSAALVGTCSGVNIGIDGTMTTPDFYQSVTQPVTSAISSLSTSLTSSIQTNLNQTVRDLSKVIEATGKAQMAHIEKIHEADRTNTLEVEKQKVITQKSMDGAYLPAGNTCADRAAAATASASDGTVAYQAKRYGAAMRYRAAKAPDTREQLNDAVENHRIYYCDPATDPLRCNGHAPAKTFSKNGKQITMPDADSSAKTLFDGAGNGEHISNLTYVPEQMDAAGAYINSALAVGDTPRALSPAEAKTDEGQVYQGLKLAYEARISLSREVLLQIQGSRAPIEGSDQLLQGMVDSTSADYGMKDYVQGRVKEIQKFQAFNSSPKVSPMELLDIQVKSRSDNPGWLAYINNAERDQVVKEQTVMMSLQLRMQYMQLRQQEMTSALLAINSAETTKANLLPKINTTMSNLTRHQ